MRQGFNYVLNYFCLPLIAWRAENNNVCVCVCERADDSEVQKLYNPWFGQIAFTIFLISY